MPHLRIGYGSLLACSSGVLEPGFIEYYNAIVCAWMIGWVCIFECVAYSYRTSFILFLLPEFQGHRSHLHIVIASTAGKNFFMPFLQMDNTAGVRDLVQYEEEATPPSIRLLYHKISFLEVNSTSVVVVHPAQYHLPIFPSSTASW